ncbi:MAG: hypothetical protein KF898_01710 [Parachlamydiales bacterium]|nr:hypothetical protein [Candidatus Acheromyda pituitae]
MVLSILRFFIPMVKALEKAARYRLTVAGFLNFSLVVSPRAKDLSSEQ